jgi:predicted nucleotidyltransferase
MELETTLREKREEIMRIARKHGASNIRVFGSVARGDADDRSDIWCEEDVPGLHVLSCRNATCRCKSPARTRPGWAIG